MSLELVTLAALPTPAPLAALPAPPPPPPPPPPPSSPPPSSLGPGFRFSPTDEELVTYYLRRKVCGKSFRFEAVTETDVYKSEPWELADYSTMKSKDLEWYFISPMDKKYGNGSRLNRATGRGYWKATGKDRVVRHRSETVGFKKTLIFHSGRSPDGKRTDWVMHEYRLQDPELVNAGVPQDAFVLCRIFEKRGLGPPSGDRCAPFIAEEWDDDETITGDDDVINSDQGNDVLEAAGNMILHQNEPSVETQIVPYAGKRDCSDDGHGPELELETISLFHNKRSKHSDPNINGNGSEDSTMSQDPRTSQPSSAPMEYPLLQSLEAKESHQSAIQPSFEAARLEKSVPPGYLKFISDLEKEVLNVSMEKESLKIEVMRAQAMIDILQSQIENLSKENAELKRGGGQA